MIEQGCRPERVERVVTVSGLVQPISNFAPCYGVRGALTSIGRGRVQCHICGKGFRNVGLHARLTHGVSPSDYRRAFGLAWDTGLVCEEFSVRQRLASAARLAKQSADAARISADRLRELAQDEDWRERHATLASQRQGGKAVLVRECVICGKEFRCAVNSRRKTCAGLGSDCDSEMRRRRATGLKHTPESRAKMSASKLKPRVKKICPVCGAEFMATMVRPLVTCGQSQCVRARLGPRRRDPSRGTFLSRGSHEV